MGLPQGPGQAEAAIGLNIPELRLGSGAELGIQLRSGLPGRCSHRWGSTAGAAPGRVLRTSMATRMEAVDRDSGNHWPLPSPSRAARAGRRLKEWLRRL